MNAHWHDQIQRCLAGDATPEETAALQQALKDDAELRALYLDYLNLDVALGAAAEAAALSGNEADRMAVFPQPPARLFPHYWRWLGAAAACAALVVLAILPKRRDDSRPLPDVAAAISTAQNAIARLSVEPPATLPAWMSPTASLLDQPQIPQ